ncbi:MAG: ligase-associated DNA damage response exonuclease [Ignavibacteriaceae bacterium]|nr:ligase-associated DNA damage response exonuclease [Ignavibacteriaceae bacterium]
MNFIPLVRLTDKGLFCEIGGFYIDPNKSVDKALITHAHSDHARPGSKSYLTVKPGESLLKQRLGQNINLQTVNYSEPLYMNGVKVSFHPAGHILGSSQIRIEYYGEVWVISGDYKLEKDLTCEMFEPIKCNTFITESTFGLPIFKWLSQNLIFKEINSWWRCNKELNIISIILGYSIGKAQRIISGLDSTIGTIYAHPSIEVINQCYRIAGIKIPETQIINEHVSNDLLPGSLIIAPPSADIYEMIGKHTNFSSAFASGWMQIRKNRKRISFDRGFTLSDHADWEGLLQAAKESQAANILVTHGYSSQLAKWLREKRLNASVLEIFPNRTGEY